MHGPGPNDFFIDNGTQKPGLGPDEPSVQMRAQMAASSEAERHRLEAITRAEQLIQTEAEALELRRVELEAREKKLAEREAQLTASLGINVDEE